MLWKPGIISLLKVARAYKRDALVDKVQLIHANPTVASIRFATGKKENVSISHFAWKPVFETVGELLVSKKDGGNVKHHLPANVPSNF